MMECNKEEAIRAKEIAEKKMQNKDYFGARKIALKAQQLYPDLENISQLLLVCDVHLSAESSGSGIGKDWYSILKIESTADDASIRKQYRKLALMLHPDKNNFAGASDAFKLIGEAHKLLLDREKRVLYDLTLKKHPKPDTVIPKQQVNKNSVMKRHTQNQSMGRTAASSTSFATQQQQHQNQQPQEKQQQKSTRETFWTMCPFCTVKYQYYREVINKTFKCQRCEKTFTGYEIQNEATSKPTPWFHKNHGVSMPPNGGKMGSQSNGGFGSRRSEPVPKKVTSEVGGGPKVETKFTAEAGEKRKKQPKASSERCDSDSRKHENGASKPPNGGKMGSDSNGSFESSRTARVLKKETSEVGGGPKVVTKLSAKAGEKRKKQSEESIERCEFDSIKHENAVFVKENGNVKPKLDSGSCSESCRRSMRAKTDTYNESLSDHDKGSPLKKAKSNGAYYANGSSVSGKEPSTCDQVEKELSSRPVEDNIFEEVEPKEIKKKDDSSTATGNREKTNGEAKDGVADDSSSDGPSVPEFYECPDPDFNDFDNYRRDDCFAVGQVWALYDPLDAMPRYYARIKKIFSSSEFKLSILWQEAEPDDEDENKWVGADLPVSCGKYVNGSTETIIDRLMFSHPMDWEKGRKRDTLKIYPQKRETWALFKNWDMNWHSDPESKRKYEYEFVEILTDYCERDGVSVAYLGKVKGFSCLFCRTAVEGVDSFLIPRNQLFRFSHRVPSFQLSGTEREGIPENSFELDPASLPANIAEIDVPGNSKIEVDKVEISDGSSLGKSEKKMESSSVEKNMESSSVERITESDSEEMIMETDSEGTGDHRVESPDAFQIPDPEFFNFDGEKSSEKFHPGQFWALYGDEDGMPKYYAIIKNAIHDPEFSVKINWLSANPSDNTISFVDKSVPVGCGIFKRSKSGAMSYTDTVSFSHRLRVDHTDKKDVYAIYPKKDEVWAVYKNWNPGMTCSDLENCEYDFVLVLEENDFGFKSLVLEMVSGHTSVFKVQKNDDGSPVSMQIVRAELLKFSHQVPAFKLTDEKGGSLRGCWELDPAALPVHMLLR